MGCTGPRNLHATSKRVAVKGLGFESHRTNLGLPLDFATDSCVAQ